MVVVWRQWTSNQWQQSTRRKDLIEGEWEKNHLRKLQKRNSYPAFKPFLTFWHWHFKTLFNGMTDWECRSWVHGERNLSSRVIQSKESSVKLPLYCLTSFFLLDYHLHHREQAIYSPSIQARSESCIQHHLLYSSTVESRSSRCVTEGGGTSCSCSLEAIGSVLSRCTSLGSRLQATDVVV